MKKKKKSLKKKKIIKKGKIETKKIKQNLYKPNDEKVQITKIKKQAVEKRIYNVNDYVVYPKHGVGKIIAVEKDKDILALVEQKASKKLKAKEKRQKLG